MSSPKLRCSSVAIFSSRSEQVTRLQIVSSIGSRCRHSSVALRSGEKDHFTFFQHLHGFAVETAVHSPVASHTKSGMNRAATSAVFSLSTMATGLADMAAEVSESRCSPNRLPVEIRHFLYRMDPVDLIESALNPVPGYGIVAHNLACTHVTPDIYLPEHGRTVPHP